MYVDFDQPPIPFPGPDRGSDYRPPMPRVMLVARVLLWLLPVVLPLAYFAGCWLAQVFRDLFSYH